MAIENFSYQSGKIVEDDKSDETSGKIRKKSLVRWIRSNNKQNYHIQLFSLSLFLLCIFLSMSCINYISQSYEETTQPMETRLFQVNSVLEKEEKERTVTPPKCSSYITGIGTKHPRDKNQQEDILCCDRSHHRTDICYAKGSIKAHGASASVILNSVQGPPSIEKVRPYTRKWEKQVMEAITQITVKKLPTHHNHSIGCDVVHNSPGLVYSTGGYTGNLYHEFNDGLIPLYITSQHLKGNIVLLVTDYQKWWHTKYSSVLAQISRHPIINFNNDNRTHCFKEILAGLRIHNELTIDSSQAPSGLSISNFTELLESSYKTPEYQPKKPPRLVIISRNSSRAIMNQNSLVKLAKKVGFEARVVSPSPTTQMAEMMEAMRWCDVMVGVHGAALTHILMMRRGAVFIQIVPLGTDWPSWAYYGEPATKMGLRYMEYRILPQESSLYKSYAKDDPVLTRPSSVASMGWDVTKRVYLDSQNVKLSLRRFKPFLIKAYRHFV